MHVRIAETGDGADIARIYAPIVRDTSISFEMVPPTADEMSARIESTLATHPWLVIDKDGEVTAYAYATPHRSRSAYQWSCDVSVYVGEAARRNGAARTLYENLFSTLVQQGFVTAFAGIALPNAASVGFHEHMGFRSIGVYPKVGFKMGSWRDVGWWGLPLRVVDGNPANPLPFSENRHTFRTR